MNNYPVTSDQRNVGKLEEVNVSLILKILVSAIYYEYQTKMPLCLL